jgi:hypothetical protein
MRILKEFEDTEGGNQDPYIEEKQTTQWPKEKGQKDKQRSIKHTHKTDRPQLKREKKKLITVSKSTLLPISY